ncbi:MAG: 2-oxoglutarate and iron-dependent oxygenase domain-containing protein [Gloeomargarita sp. SKYBB_i_bin120]|nr:2-oxoglutarate and iron-dependent oxygenase domain-containing protein [Gloeomargarita sp. SKYB120]MDW8178090.1 2-oxoglutarate and iron-dependent oxygenase domain-containing protein [Gloeomargarita sp. SKYBB_i_bin120]
MTTALPVVSLVDWTQGTPAQRHEFVWQVGQALEKVGFFVLVDHGLTPDLLAAAYEQVVALFALPLAQKQRYAKPEWHGQRGYVSLGQEHAQGHPLPDWKEFWHIGRTNNLWPQELPDVAPILTRLYAALVTPGDFPVSRPAAGLFTQPGAGRRHLVALGALPTPTGGITPWHPASSAPHGH